MSVAQNVATVHNQSVRTYIQSHFLTLDDFQYPSMRLESLHLSKDSWNSGTFEVNFLFRTRHETGSAQHLQRRLGWPWSLQLLAKLNGGMLKHIYVHYV